MGKLVVQELFRVAQGLLVGNAQMILPSGLLIMD